MLTVGTSAPGPCAVRDYATALAAALGADREVWPRTPPRRGWLDGLRADRRLLRDAYRAAVPGEVAVVHWSPFSHGTKGVPLAAALVPMALRRKGMRVVTVLHELAYPWGRSGARGLVWATAQRLSLAKVLLGSHLLVVTTPERARQLRRWRVDPGRILVRPVWATVPAAGEPEPGRVGSLSWHSEAALREVAVDAADRLGVRLCLLGAPGRVDGWGDAEFSGVLPIDELGRELGRLDVYLHLDHEGPTPRRTSLASALAAGRCVVAFDGRQTWAPLRDAVALAPPTGEGLARVLGELLADPARRRRLGQAAREVYRREMDLAETARLLKERLS